jgi:hypothetical protein
VVITEGVREVVEALAQWAENTWRRMLEQANVIPGVLHALALLVQVLSTRRFE